MKRPLRNLFIIGLITALSALCGTAQAVPADIPSAAEDLYQITLAVSNIYQAIGISDIYSTAAAAVAAAAGAAAAAVICLTAALISRRDHREPQLREPPEK